MERSVGRGTTRGAVLRGVGLRRQPAPSRAPAPPPRAQKGPLDGVLEALPLPPPFGGPAKALNDGIAGFYDESSSLWEQIWGDHMHHGYYPGGRDRSDHRQAQVDMIDNALAWAGVDAEHAPGSMLDVGCGIGGSSRHIARRFGCAATGITLSPVQADRANALSEQEGFEDLDFMVADALKQPFGDDTFDFVWSMESGEHMPDKRKFVGELARVCEPGGRILIVTWCHRNLNPGESALPPDEQFLLDRICDAYYLPAWCSVADYERIAKELGLEDIRTADWSLEVQPFWRAVIETALTPEGVVGLLQAGPTTIAGAFAMPGMQLGLARGTIRFNLITATVPKADAA